jgi:hypothetical protein
MNAATGSDFCRSFRARGRMFRPMMLVRIVERVSVALCCAYACARRTTAPRGGRAARVHHLRFSAAGVDYRVTTDASISALGEDRPVVIEDALAFIVGPDESVELTPLTLARTFLEETRCYWQDWVRTLAVPFDWQEAVIRAAITLKLCTFRTDCGASGRTSSHTGSPDSGRSGLPFLLAARRWVVQRVNDWAPRAR